MIKLKYKFIFIFMLLLAAVLIPARESGADAVIKEEDESLKTYKNPMDIDHAWQDGELGDPFVMRFNGRYYLYCSGWDTYLKCWSSETLVNWEYEGEIARDQELRNAYAPEVVYARDGYFYMVTSTPHGAGHRLLRSASPLGPFEFITENIGRMIDGSLFFDDDGREYFYRADGSGIKSSEITDYTEFGYEKSTGAYLGHWTEGPQVFKRGGLYFMTLTGNHVLSEGYRIAYAVSEYPDKDFVMPRNSVLVINTTDGYWALGHNSVVMGPDMDSYYMAFHNNRLYSPNRKFNLDRLFFNGTKLTATAPNDWEQPVPVQPEFYAWEDEGKGMELEKIVIKEEEYSVSRTESNSDFIAEWNISSGDLSAVFSYQGEKNYGLAELSGNILRLSEIRDGRQQVLTEGTVPEGSNQAAHHALRLEKTGGTLALFYDGMHRLETETTLSGGRIGASVRAGELRYIAFSNTSGGTSDYMAPKSIPGTFDAVHYLPGKGEGYQSEGGNESDYRRTDTVNIRKTQSGSHAVLLQDTGDWLRYAISVRETGLYSLDVRLSGALDGAELAVSTEGGEEKNYKIKDLQVRDEEGFTVVTLGELLLEEGFLTLKVELLKGKDILLESFSGYKSAKVETAVELIKESERVGKTGWKFLGSVVREFEKTEYGYIPPHIQTKAFTGDTGWQDYGIEATIPGGLEGTSGMLQLYLRSTNESWYEAQVENAFFGYRLTIAPKFVILEKCRYDSEKLADIRLETALSEDAHLRVLLEGQKLRLYINGELVMDYTDPDPITHGRIGIGGSHRERGFSELSVFPIVPDQTVPDQIVPDTTTPDITTPDKEASDTAADRRKFLWNPVLPAALAVILAMAAAGMIIIVKRLLKRKNK